ncbi:hypothetical protein Mapa_001787 [Marchantia paleacea]|nr:hypothetical protein Mapa_001787 [Marchantia paleacea]
MSCCYGSQLFFCFLLLHALEFQVSLQLSTPNSLVLFLAANRHECYSCSDKHICEPIRVQSLSLSLSLTPFNRYSIQVRKNDYHYFTRS